MISRVFATCGVENAQPKVRANLHINAQCLYRDSYFIEISKREQFSVIGKWEKVWWWNDWHLNGIKWHQVNFLNPKHRDCRKTMKALNFYVMEGASEVSPISNWALALCKCPINWSRCSLRRQLKLWRLLRIQETFQAFSVSTEWKVKLRRRYAQSNQVVKLFKLTHGQCVEQDKSEAFSSF